MSDHRAVTPAEQSLYEAARKAQARAYVPASRFAVGAAVSMHGEVVTGANFENDSYGLTICAERAAIAVAVAHGLVRAAIAAGADERDPRCLNAIAIHADALTVSPCGACRQVIGQFAAPGARVIYPRDGELTSVSFGDLLPDKFRLQ
ncbi:cytidine deaminase [Patulibacter sp. SYSU D01012]|uniref:cytidine deaminase n=1 Tax=Patulibacter sp. SYSU D01012 TaxID=2817381 RepID=UPI001B303E05|nr:cytidine deaminase [Patulibacter sp. SYSU D01012]